MPTIIEGKEIDALDLIPPDEGSLKQLYGHIGNFKTYYASVLAFKLLERGQVVKTNWQLYDNKEKNILWSGYDERKEFLPQLLFKLGIKKEFLIIPKENWEFFKISDVWANEKGFENFQDWLAHQTDCTLMIDEGHIVYDSYKMTRMSMDERVMMTSTRHFDRTIYIISQRPSAIHANFRGNVNQFYKCEEIEKGGWFGRRFKVTEFQDTDSNDKPDETREEIKDEDTGEVTEWHYKFAIAEEILKVDKKMFNRYNTKYLRGDMKASQHNLAKIEKPKWSEIKLFNKK